MHLHFRKLNLSHYFFVNLKTHANLNVDKTTEPTDECGATPENPWIIGNSPRAESSDIDISASSIDRMVGKSKGKKSAATAKEDDVISGKRRRTVPKKLNPPFHLTSPASETHAVLSHPTILSQLEVLLLANLLLNLLPFHVLTVLDVRNLSCRSV